MSKIIVNNKIDNNRNNLGSQNYDGILDEIGNYKFTKFKNAKQLNYKPIFLNNSLIFFDKKGTIIKYDNNQEITWKKNYYSKLEKKLKPKLYLAIHKKNLLIADSIAKYYSLNVDTGKLNWVKNNRYPFNSSVKTYKDKFFVVDYKNTLKCYYIKSGSECWSLQTDDSFTISDTKYSINIIDKLVFFSNSICYITAVDIETGLITWQLPTQSSSIINETFNFKTSNLVSDDNSIFFSNNKSEFYSIDLKTGTSNWINKINSILRPIIIENFIFTVSINGYLFVIEKNSGNIIRITDLYKNYKIKTRKNIKPVGFTIGKTNLYLTNSNGSMIVANLQLGNISKIKKISRNFISEPFIYNQNLFIIRNGSIIQYN